MDFHNMKRKRLQSLCKKYGIPANLKNTEMAESLSLIFKGKDKSGSSQSGLDDSVVEKGTLQCNEDIIILDEEEETQVNELKSNNTDNHQMVDSDTASGDADIYHGKLESSHKRSAIPSSEENSTPDLVIERPSAVVIKYVNPLLCDDNKCDDNISADDCVCKIKKGGFEVEPVDTIIHERSNSSKDSQKEVHSDSCNDSDEKPDQLLPTTPQIEVKSGNLNVHQIVASDTSEAKGLSMQTTIPVEDSEKCIGFSPEPLEASVIKGMEPIAFFTPRISTWDMQDSIQSAKMELVDKSHEVLHEQPNAVDIHDSSLMKISTEHFKYNLVEQEHNSVGDNVYVHGDHRGAEVEMVSSDPSQLKLSQKRSPDEDLEDSNALSPDPLESSVIEGTETETEFMPRTIDILETCDGEKIIPSVKKQKVDNSQEALRTSPHAVVVSVLNLWQDSSEEFSYSVLEGEVKKLSDNVDVSVIGKAGAEAEAENQVVTKSLDRSNCAKDTLDETSVTYGPFLVETQSPNYEDMDMDESPAQLLLSMPQIEVNSCNSNIHDKNSSDTSQVKLSEKTGPVADSEISTGFSPKLHGTSEITNLTPLTPGGILGTCDAQESMHCNKIEQVDYTEEVLLAAPNAVAIDNANAIHVSAGDCSYNLVEGEVKKSGDNIDVQHDAFETVKEEAEIGKYVDTKSFERSNWTDDSFGKTSVTAGCSLHEVQFDSNNTDEKLGTCDVQESMQCDKIEQVHYIEEVLCTAPNAVAIDNANVINVSTEECSYDLVEGEVKKSGDNIDVHHDAFGTVKEEVEIGKYFDTNNLERSNWTDDSFGKTNVTAGSSLHEVQFDSNNTDEKRYQFPPAVSQTEVNSYNRNIHEMVYSEDICQLQLLSASSVADLEESSPMLFKSSGVKTFEAKPNSAPKITNFPKSCVAMEQVGNHQEVFLVAPDATVINEVNLLQVSTEEFCHSLLVGDGTNFHDNGTENGESESEKQAGTLGVERVNMAKDALGNSDMSLGYCLNELQSADSASCKDSDEPFIPENASDIASGDANAYQEKLHSSQTENGGSESEKQVDMLGIERVNMANDALGNSDMTLGHCLNELQSVDSASCKDSDEPFMPEHASDTASGDAIAYQEKLHSSQTENGGSESEKQADKLGIERVNMAKDALGNFGMTLGYCLNELQSVDGASCKDSDEPFMPEHASDTASGDANAYQEKLHSSQKDSSVKNSEESIGFSPKLLESSMIQGLEAATNLIVKTPRPRDILGTFDMKENMQSAKKQVGTITSKKTAHKRQPLQDIQQN